MKRYSRDVNKLNLKTYVDLYLSRIAKENTKYYYQIYLYKMLELESFTEVTLNKFLNGLEGATDTSKKTVRAVIVAFFNWLNRTQGTTLDTKEIKTFVYSPNLKSIYTPAEKEKAFSYLREFGNLKFELYFRIIAYNGCRLAESVSINLFDLLDQEKVQIQTLKRGKKRMIFSDENILFLLTKVDLTPWTKQTLANYFAMFKKYVKKRDPNWRLDIKASQLRTQFITDLSRNRLNSSEIQMITGHSTTNVIENTYILTDPVQMEKTFKRGKLPLFDALNLEQIERTFNNLNDKVAALQEELDALSERRFNDKKNAVREFIFAVRSVLGETAERELKKIYDQMFFTHVRKSPRTKYNFGEENQNPLSLEELEPRLL